MLEGLEESKSGNREAKKPWRIDFDFKELVIGLEDEPMLQMFTNHDEIVEIYAQR